MIIASNAIFRAAVISAGIDFLDDTFRCIGANNVDRMLAGAARIRREILHPVVTATTRRTRWTGGEQNGGINIAFGVFGGRFDDIRVIGRAKIVLGAGQGGEIGIADGALVAVATI